MIIYYVITECINTLSTEEHSEMKKFSFIGRSTLSDSSIEMKNYAVKACNFTPQETSDDSFYVHGSSHVCAYKPSSFDNLPLEEIDISEKVTWRDIENVEKNVECQKVNRHHNEYRSFFGKHMSERFACDSKAHLLELGDKYHAKDAKEEHHVYEGDHHIAIPHEGYNQLYRLPTGELMILPETIETRGKRRPKVTHLEGIPHEHREEIVEENTLHSLRNIHTGSTLSILVPLRGKEYFHERFFSLAGRYYMLEQAYFMSRASATFHRLVYSDVLSSYIPEETPLYSFDINVKATNGKGFILIVKDSDDFGCRHIFSIIRPSIESAETC